MAMDGQVSLVFGKLTGRIHYNNVLKQQKQNHALTPVAAVYVRKVKSIIDYRKTPHKIEQIFCGLNITYLSFLKNQLTLNRQIIGTFTLNQNEDVTIITLLTINIEVLLSILDFKKMKSTNWRGGAKITIFANNATVPRKQNSLKDHWQQQSAENGVVWLD